MRRRLRRGELVIALGLGLLLHLGGCSGDEAGPETSDGGSSPSDALADEDTVGPYDGVGDVPIAADTPPVTDTPPVPDVPPSVDAVADSGTPLDSDATPPPPGWWEDLAPGGVTMRDLLGVASHMNQKAAPNALRDFELDMYEELGGIGFREHFRWNHVEPEDGTFVWEGYDVQVALAKEHGCDVLPMVGYDVAWARQRPGVDASIRPDDFEDYARHVAERYCDDISTYEIWNEPNIDVFWEPEPDAAAYGEILKAAWRGIKSACPDARVGTGGIAFWDLRHFDADWTFVRDLYAAHPDICDAFDVMMVHPYTWLMQRSPENDAAVGTIETPGYVTMIGRLRALLAEMGCPDRPIVYTEAGWPSYTVGEELQARWLARAMLLSAMLGIEGYYWYTFWDSEPDPETMPPQEDWFGLFAWPGEDGSVRREKPAFTAMRGLVTALGDARYAGSLGPTLALPDDVYALAFVTDAGALSVAVWDGRDDPDGSLGPPREGGIDTHHDVLLPLPPGTTAVVAHDFLGAEIDPPEAIDGALPLRLAPRPVYLRFVGADRSD